MINQLEKIVGSDTTGKLFRIPVTNDSNNILGLVTMDMLQTFNKNNKPNHTSYEPHVLVVGGAGYIGSILTEIILSPVSIELTTSMLRVLPNTVCIPSRWGCGEWHIKN